MSMDIAADVRAQAGAGYEVVLADPPWAFNANTGRDPGRNARRHYPCMALEDIAAIPVRGMVADNAALFMWITTPFLAAGAHVPIMRAWGFKPVAVAFTWIKTKRGTSWPHLLRDADLHMGTGLTTRKNSEVLLLGKRGRSLRVHGGVSEIIIAPVREHSRKPLEAAERIVQYVGPGRRMVEMFSRETATGFDPLGNQVGRFDRAAA